MQENWWVIKIEVKEEADYTVTQKTQLAEARREALVKAKRAELAGKIRRNFDAADLRWAAAHAKAGENPSGAVSP